MNTLVDTLLCVRPSKRQIQWQETEFYAFVHFGINQFTDREWGNGQESPSIFDPKFLNTDQWCQGFVSAGMKGVILTAKHHDGFCLWNTKHTKHSVMYSPYRKDIVAQLAVSCRKHNLKLGIYLSPWDRHDPRYGQGKAYDDYFCAQLTELLTQYGEVFCLWFDGACGEGQNGKKQRYDWERYYEVIRRLQPNAVISVCGPDVRWCGNEAGHCRKSEWSVVPASLKDNEKIQENSQQKDDGLFRHFIPTDDEDLGSREVVKEAGALAWYPAEVNTSIRPGWFYHANEDAQVRSLEELQQMYLQSVGGNATFLLNVPPCPDGYLAEPDMKRLAEMGLWLQTTFRQDALQTATFQASSQAKDHFAYWLADADDSNMTLEASGKLPFAPTYAVLQEEIQLSQRIEQFVLEALVGDTWVQAGEGTVIGYKRILPLFEKIISNRWRIRVTRCRGGATLKTFSLYET
ncbi:MAG: alpha-L-fucosidase [Clostridiales bacterium]|nr:alpha-L-fucosidase [Clostridiales bacterium]